MSIIVLLQPIHFFKLSFINLKSQYSQLKSKGDNDYLPFQKTNKSIDK